MSWLGRGVVRILDGFLAAYQRVISPWLGPRCRFHPTCSHYARRSLAVHGPWRGTALAVGRVLRCHPFHPGGHDPVPEAANRRAPARLAEAETSP